MRIAVFALALFAIASTSLEDLRHAQEQFNAGAFASAAATYDDVAETGVANGEFFFNQGNAHYLAGDYPAAIRAYRRAERFRPNDAQLKSNLAAARALVLESPGYPKRVGPNWLPRLSRATQVWIVLVLAIIAWIVLFRWLWTRVRAQAVLGLALAVLALGWAIAISMQEREEARRPFAVVRISGIPLRKGNGESYPPVTVNNAAYDLHRGVEVRVLLAKPNDWFRVELSNGVIGWLPRSALLLDREPSEP